MRAISGTRGSSGLGSHNRLQIDSRTVCVCVCGVCVCVCVVCVCVCGVCVVFVWCLCVCACVYVRVKAYKRCPVKFTPYINIG